MTSSARLRNSTRAGAVAALIAATLAGAFAGCAHKPPAVGASAPIAVVTLPKVGAEAQAEFNEGLRTMKMGRKHYKDARQHLIKATQIDGNLGSNCPSWLIA